jgi:hypothetical protein
LRSPEFRPIAGILTECKNWIEVNLSLSYQAEFRLSDGIPAENLPQILAILSEFMGIRAKKDFIREKSRKSYEITSKAAL